MGQIDPKHSERVFPLCGEDRGHSLAIVLSKEEEEREAEHSHPTEVSRGILPLEPELAPLLGASLCEWKGGKDSGPEEKERALVLWVGGVIRYLREGPSLLDFFHMEHKRLVVVLYVGANYLLELLCMISALDDECVATEVPFEFELERDGEGR